MVYFHLVFHTSESGKYHTTVDRWSSPARLHAQSVEFLNSFSRSKQLPKAH